MGPPLCLVPSGESGRLATAREPRGLHSLSLHPGKRQHRPRARGRRGPSQVAAHPTPPTPAPQCRHLPLPWAHHCHLPSSRCSNCVALLCRRLERPVSGPRIRAGRDAERCPANRVCCLADADTPEASPGPRGAGHCSQGSGLTVRGAAPPEHTPFPLACYCEHVCVLTTRMLSTRCESLSCGPRLYFPAAVPPPDLPSCLRWLVSPPPAPVRPRVASVQVVGPLLLTVGPESCRGAGFATRPRPHYQPARGPPSAPWRRKSRGRWRRSCGGLVWGHAVTVAPPSASCARGTPACSCARWTARLVLSVITVLSCQTSTNSFSFSFPPCLCPPSFLFQFLFLFLFFSLAFILWS